MPAIGRRVAAVVLVVTAVAATAVAWLQEPADVTAAEAVRAAENAYDTADVDPATVEDDPERGVYEPDDGGPTVAVWRTVATVEGGTVELWLAVDDGEPVFLDDRSAEGDEHLLSDAAYEALGDHHERPALGRQIRRNVALTVAAALIVIVAVGLAGFSRLPVGRRVASRPLRADPERA